MSTPPPPIGVVAARVAELRRLVAQVRGDEHAIRIVAVTKTFDASAWVVARDAGCDAVGENYAQEIAEKLDRVDIAPLPLHFIGHLQSNKVRALASHVALWHTVDRPSLVSALEKEAARLGVAPRVLLQVNATAEEQKSGCAPSDLAGLVARARAAGLVVEGLMTMGPTDGDPVATRTAFATTARLAAEHGLGELSMGMTHDVRIAIEEGSTIVRIGTGIFGERPRSA